ncbi:heavy-metal-associated domain-containing protein [Treponema zuelzerae]|uniref:Heavy-metal-associated domain-containing protein n=1 Tax=Teretinema zuelzerae TaxID=156 RepID=A0AAE3JKP9_9SPIR|nr:heavy-metal-associated domain-containing protein [Teretinema zuelzerae]
MTVTLKIQGMSCGHCSARVEKALNSLPGVSARVNLAEAYATVEAPEGFPLEQLTQAVEKAGYAVIK